GITELEGYQLTVAGNAVMPRATFSDQGSNIAGTRGRTDEIGLIPNLYYTHTINEDWSYGVGINAPFGLVSDYDDNWTGRYLATYSDLQLININVVFAFSVNEYLSLGAGVNYQSMDVRLENQIDSTLGVNPDPTTDSSVRIEGDDSDVVFDLSAHFRPTDAASFGIVWRQGGEFSLSGDANFTLNQICSPGQGFPTGAPPAPTTGDMCAA